MLQKTAAEPETAAQDLPAVDNIRTLPNGIRVRVRHIPLDVSAFLVLDAQEGAWVIRAEGLHVFGLGINAVLERQPREAWIQASETGLCANVTKDAVPVLTTLLEEVLSSPECMSCFQHDPTVERPVPYHPHDGSALRTCLALLEAE